MNSVNINRIIQSLKNSFNVKESLYDKLSLVRSIKKYPHKDISSIVNTLLISILSDNRFTIQDRRAIIDNPEFESIEYHIFYFNNFHYPKYNVQYKINSCRYIISNSRHDTHYWRECISFLYNTIKDKRLQEYKLECEGILNVNRVTSMDISNIVNNRISINERYDTESNIDSLIKTRVLDGDKKRRIVFSRKTLYSDSQNVHTSNINSSVKSIFTSLIDEFIGITNDRLSILNSLSKRVTLMCKNFDMEKRKRVTGTLDRILSDYTVLLTHREIDLTLTNSIVLVWRKIQSSEHIEELEMRLIEEMIDMNGMCITGHFSRLANVLSGFHYSVSISEKDRIKSIVFSRLNTILEGEREDTKSMLVEQMISESLDEKKDIIEFIRRNNIYHRLKEDNNEIGDLDEIFNTTIKQYCGIDVSINIDFTKEFTFI